MEEATTALELLAGIQRRYGCAKASCVRAVIALCAAATLAGVWGGLCPGFVTSDSVLHTKPNFYTCKARGVLCLPQDDLHP